jgi:hypothetical protein
MSNQLFCTLFPNNILFELLEKICLKKDKYFVFDINAYKIMLFHNLNEPFLNTIIDYYYSSKQFYITRKLTYNSFTTIIRQICKNNCIMFNSKTKYTESKYDIEYHIYF